MKKERLPRSLSFFYLVVGPSPAALLRLRYVAGVS